jgi:hypothetical protein
MRGFLSQTEILRALGRQFTNFVTPSGTAFERLSNINKLIFSERQILHGLSFL